ncbi:uncharacterized protein LOC119670241 [Teleopsis dalmanni]|uniref:uncharacterized protein LOC119670241 n=1 Tax=Teleopsis dalmanni TaxID=139649 RepID=UPI0018CE65E5|nr:uncharacterized protein LOC119670241 [Teleopsis dalmanni]
MRCLSLGTPPVMTPGGRVPNLPNSASTTNGPQVGLSDQSPENLSNSHGKDTQNQSSEMNGTTGTNGQSPPSNFTMMHPAFQQHPQHKMAGQQERISNENDDKLTNGCEKTYTELKLYKEQTDQNLNGTLRSHLNMNSMSDAHMLAAAAALEGHCSDDGSDGSDSEEIDLTSGACIDFSNNKPQHPSHAQHQQAIGSTNGVH